MDIKYAVQENPGMLYPPEVEQWTTEIVQGSLGFIMGLICLLIFNAFVSGKEDPMGDMFKGISIFLVGISLCTLVHGIYLLITQ